MVHTLPDYSTKYKLVKVFGNVDTAELGCRLGAQATEDRRGSLLWYDDFESTVNKWVMNSGVGGSSCALSGECVRYGNQGVKIVTPDSSLQTVQMYKYFTLAYDSTIGAEIYYCFKDKNIRSTFELVGFDGTTVWEGRVDVNLSADYLGIYNDITGMIQLDDWIPFIPRELMWMVVKLVIDWVNKEYVRLIVGNTIYDLTGIPLWTYPSLVKPALWMNMNFMCTDDTNKTLYLDSFTLTQSEPSER